MDGNETLAYLIEPVAENKIIAEIDVDSVKKGGKDPYEYIQPYANRMTIIHLKDMTTDERQAFAEVGEGIIDFKPILKWGEANGIKWYAVEQDICERPPLDCLQTSLNNLKKMVEEIRNE